MRFKEFLIEGGGAYMQRDKYASDRVFNLDEIRAMQALAKKHNRDFDHHDTLAEIGPDQHDTHKQVHTDIRKDIYRKEPGKRYYTIEETVYTGEGDDHQEHPGDSFKSLDFELIIKRLDRLLG